MSNLNSDEKLTTIKVSEYIQCRDCSLTSDGTPYSNHYTKSSCKAYPYPGMKPADILLKGIHNCQYFRRADKVNEDD